MSFVVRMSVFCASCLLAVLVPASSVQADPRPNIVFILADDLGWSDLHTYGNDVHSTPNLDALADRGLRFTDAYAASPVCSPTRSSILSGKYPARTGLTNWLWRYNSPSGIRPARGLALAEATLAEALRSAGYATGIVGKWHLGGPGYAAGKQGFDVVVGAILMGKSWRGYFLPNGLDLPRAKKGEYLTDHLTDEGIRFIEDNREKPFFLYQAYYAVHQPIEGRPDLVAANRARLRKEGRSANADYAAMVESLDEGVGRILAKLEELGLSERTIVFFFSDNGGFSHELGDPNNVMSNLPLRMGKGHLYEGGIRQPLIVRYPPLVEAGGVSSVPVISTDFYPTILELAGVAAMPDQHIDGVSIAPLLENPSAELDRDAIFFHYPHSNPQGGVPSGAIRTGDFKMIEFFEEDRVELYDLGADLGETKDLALSEPGKAKQLRERLADWRRSVGAKMPR